MKVNLNKLPCIILPIIITFCYFYVNNRYKALTNGFYKLDFNKNTSRSTSLTEWRFIFLFAFLPSINRPLSLLTLLIKLYLLTRFDHRDFSWLKPLLQMCQRFCRSGFNRDQPTNRQIGKSSYIKL